MIPVEGHKHLYREKSGAIINTDANGYANYMRAKNKKLSGTLFNVVNNTLFIQTATTIEKIELNKKKRRYQITKQIYVKIASNRLFGDSDKTPRNVDDIDVEKFITSLGFKVFMAHWPDKVFYRV